MRSRPSADDIRAAAYSGWSAADGEEAHSAHETGLPRWLWLTLPLLLALIQFVTFAISPPAFHRWLDGELGLVELLTPVLLVVAIVAGIAAWRHRHRAADPRLGVWLLCLIAGCIYFAGEEISWGQHLFGWDTPQALLAINDQGETNLHNMSSWFDQKPRWALEVFVVIGGVIVPLLRRYRPGRWLARWPNWFWPTHVCVCSAILVVTVRLPERINDALGTNLFSPMIRYSEAQELFFAYFLMLYLLSLRRRLSAESIPPGKH